MKHYYITNPNSEKGFEEVTEAEFLTIIGDKEHCGYATQVYNGLITIDEVPEDKRETVSAIVAARVNKFGEYNSQPIPATELKEMMEEAL